MKLRFPREELSASLATIRSVDPTLDAIACELTAEWAWFGTSVSPADIELRHVGVDPAGWDAHEVLLGGRLIALTDSPLAA